MESGERIRLAVTVDDLFQWKGMPVFDGYDYASVAKRLSAAFNARGISGVYAFSNTAPADDGYRLSDVFDTWSAGGHHIGNHTHHHDSLNWVSPQTYIADIEKTEALIAPWLERSPRRYFRFCFDMWGDTQEKRDAVCAYLARQGYEIAPISLWFYDAQFNIAYMRAIMNSDAEARKWLRARFVRTAVDQLAAQSAAARLIFGREPAHIWLIHGTPIVADCIEAVLDAFQERGVEFVSLAEAMRDPMNREQPIVTARFRNQVQKWAEARGIPIADCPPMILRELDNISPIPGLSGGELMAALIGARAQELGPSATITDFQIE